MISELHHGQGRENPALMFLDPVCIGTGIGRACEIEFPEIPRIFAIAGESLVVDVGPEIFRDLVQVDFIEKLLCRIFKASFLNHHVVDLVQCVVEVVTLLQEKTKPWLLVVVQIHDFFDEEFNGCLIDPRRVEKVCIFAVAFDQLDFKFLDGDSEAIPGLLAFGFEFLEGIEIKSGGVQAVGLGMKTWSLVGLGGEELRDLVFGCGVDVVRFRHDVSPSLVAICSSEPPRRFAEYAARD